MYLYIYILGYILRQIQLAIGPCACDPVPSRGAPHADRHRVLSKDLTEGTAGTEELHIEDKEPLTLTPRP